MIDVFDNSAVIRGIYKEQIPSLNNVEIHEINIVNGEDLICNIRFDLSEYPSEPPLKWKQAEYNTSQISLKLIGSQITAIDLKRRINKGNLVLESEDGEKVLKFIQDSGPNIIIKCKWVYIDGITGYIK